MPVPTAVLTAEKQRAKPFSKQLYSFNGQLLNENPDDFIHQTVGHEWAHLLCHYRHGPGRGARQGMEDHYGGVGFES